MSGSSEPASHDPDDQLVRTHAVRRHRAPRTRYAPLGKDLAAGLAQGVIGLGVVGLLVVVTALPMLYGYRAWGEDVGAAVGCGLSVLGLLGLVAVLIRYPRIPGAGLAIAIAAKIIVVYTVFAPLGLAIEYIPDRGLAALVGLLAGAGLLGGGVLVFRALPTRWKPKPRDPAMAASAATGTAVSTLITSDDGGFDSGSSGGGDGGGI
jgi:hypothetical protein